MNAAQHANAARDAGETALGRLSNAIDQLRQAARELSAASDEHVDKAAGHMHEAHNIVGSQEAEETAQTYGWISSRLDVSIVMHEADEFEKLLGRIHDANTAAGQMSARFSE
jgi:hypothetical protein